MKKETLLENLKAAKGFTSVLLIEDMIKLIEGLEPEVRIEKEIGITQELADNIASRIERCMDNNCDRLVDLDSACFELTYNNQVELTEANVSVHDIMQHVTACIDEFVVEEDEEADEEAPESEAEETSGISDAERVQIAKELEDHLEEKLKEY